MKKSGILLMYFVFSVQIFSQGLTPVNLRCENITDPVGIDIKQPRLTWSFLSDGNHVMQTGYEVIVSDNFKAINRGKGNIGKFKKTSSKDQFIVLDINKIKSFTKYYWRVKIYDNKNRTSSWSEINSFETSFLNNEWKAKWIADRDLVVKLKDLFYKAVMPVYMKDISLDKPIKSARLYISGLGYYEAYLNDLKIGDHRLDPGWTDYSKKVFYSTYDITSMLKVGNNHMKVMVGNGWYNLFPLKMWCGINFRDSLYSGVPCLKAQIRIEHTDRTITHVYTDSSWETVDGPIQNSDVFLGEIYDARNEISGFVKNARKAVEIEGPSGIMRYQMQPAIKHIKTIHPRSIKEIKKGTYLIDMGQNFSGSLKIKVKGEQGTKVDIRYGEDIYPDGTLNGMTSVAAQIKSPGCGGVGSPDIAYQTDSYILNGKGVEVWAPRFTFRGFRYAEITNWPSVPALHDFEGVVLSASVADFGMFECSDSMINKLYNNIRWTFRNNLFSVQSDCPAREKLGYGGDLLCTTNSFMYNYDMQNFYKKLLADFTEAQRENGGITETAPFVGIADYSPGNDQSGPISFQAIYPFMINELYSFYGDIRVVKDNYQSLKRQVEYLISTSKDDLHEIDISDHESLDEKPEKFSAACFYLYHLDMMRQMAKLLENKNDEQHYELLCERTRNAILIKYFDLKTGKFDNNTQSAQVFGLWFPLLKAGTPEHSIALKELLNVIKKKNDHISTGIFGTKMLFDLLRDNNLNDVAYKIVTQPDFPGWFHMIRNGATTLWETWKYSDNVYSQNHPMFGSVMAWFYNSLAGINPASPGFEDIIIKPYVFNDLMFVKSSYTCPNGMIVSEWEKDGGNLKLKMVIPAGSKAQLWIPSGELTTSLVLDINPIKVEKGFQIFNVGSGEFNFIVKNLFDK